MSLIETIFWVMVLGYLGLILPKAILLTVYGLYRLLGGGLEEDDKE